MKKKYRIVLTKKALTDLSKLEKLTSKRIVMKLEYFESTENPLIYAKKMKDPSLGQYRFRIGNYRILFDVDDKGKIVILLILKVKHRKDIY